MADSPAGKNAIAQANEALGRAPGPIPVIHLEGTLAHQGLWDVSFKAEQDLPLMRGFGLAYAMTGERSDLDAADHYFRAWLDIYAPSFNPIDETSLEPWFVAYDLTRADLPADTRAKMETFLRRVAEGYLARIDEQVAKGKVDAANWQSHRIKLIVLAAFSLGDPVLIQRAHETFRRHLSVNIAPGGEVVDFAKRDALHYVTYDLEPLTVAALAAKEHGQDWLHEPSATGSSVAAGLDWLEPYARGEKTHEEFVHSHVPFDAERARAGMQGYSGPWEPGTSATLYQYAATIDTKYQPVLDAVLRNTKQESMAWLRMLAGAGE